MKITFVNVAISFASTPSHFRFYIFLIDPIKSSSHSSMHSTGFYFTFETNIICLIGLYIYKSFYWQNVRESYSNTANTVQSEMVLMVFELTKCGYYTGYEQVQYESKSNK